ncbi:hypothetical protein [Streptomyces sp. NPDC002346]
MRLAHRRLPPLELVRRDPMTGASVVSVGPDELSGGRAGCLGAGILAWEAAGSEPRPAPPCTQMQRNAGPAMFIYERKKHFANIY